MQTAVTESGRNPEPRAVESTIMTAIVLVAIGGIAVSSVSLYEHFATFTTSFCNLSNTFNCDLVNRSSYSTVLGVPVALIGIVGYVLVATLATVYRNLAQTPVLLLVAAVGGLGFALSLAYVEKFVLGVWCILCLTSMGLICIEVMLSAIATVRTRPARN
ncbi:MAG: vitamin K epoxide reductase family protein [Terriglobales bacterium]